MASTATVTRKGNEVVVSITGTSIAAATEATIPLGFTKGRILRQGCVKTAGSGSTVDPIIGTATNPSGAAVVMESGTPAAAVDKPGEILTRERNYDSHVVKPQSIILVMSIIKLRVRGNPK